MVAKVTKQFLFLTTNELKKNMQTSFLFILYSKLPLLTLKTIFLEFAMFETGFQKFHLIEANV